MPKRYASQNTRRSLPERESTLSAAQRLRYLRAALVVVGLVCVVHGVIMTVQAITGAGQTGHLMGDVPALLVAAIVLAALTPRGKDASALRRPGP
ncbi:MAG: DUF6632 domain-containing protein [Caldimonas sp.]